jgi:hypothetical protein
MCAIAADEWVSMYSSEGRSLFLILASQQICSGNGSLGLHPVTVGLHL